MPSEDRVAVKISVPEFQRQAWTTHAEALDMSRSEFLATMIQAGRRLFEEDDFQSRSNATTPRGNGLREYVLEVLSSDSHQSFDHLVETLAADLDDELQSLSQSGTVQFSGRKGGYVLDGDSDGDH